MECLDHFKEKSLVLKSLHLIHVLIVIGFKNCLHRSHRHCGHSFKFKILSL